MPEEHACARDVPDCNCDEDEGDKDWVLWVCVTAVVIVLLLMMGLPDVIAAIKK